MSTEAKWETAELLYEYVISSDEVDPRLARSMQRIRTVCDQIDQEASDLQRRGGTFRRSPLYVAEVGRRCKAQFGGPSAESIVRNRATEPLKAAYIDLRSAELSRRVGINIDQPGAEQIEDAALRAYVTSLEQKLRVTEGLLTGTSRMLREIKAVSLDAALRAGIDESDNFRISDGASPLPSHSMLSDLAAKLLDRRHVERFGLTIEASVFNAATGEELLSPEDVELLRKLI